MGEKKSRIKSNQCLTELSNDFENPNTENGEPWLLFRTKCKKQRSVNVRMWKHATDILWPPDALIHAWKGKAMFSIIVCFAGIAQPAFCFV